MDIQTLWLLYLLFLVPLSTAVTEDKIYFTSTFKLRLYVILCKVTVKLPSQVCLPKTWAQHSTEICFITVKVVGTLCFFTHCVVTVVIIPDLMSPLWIIQQGAEFLLHVMTSSYIGKHYGLTSESQWQQEPYPVICTDCFPSENLSRWCLTPANTSSLPILQSPFLITPSLFSLINTYPSLSSLYI